MIHYIWKQLLSSRAKIWLFLHMFLIAAGAFLGMYPIVLIRKVVDMAVAGMHENVGEIIKSGVFYLIVQTAQAGANAASQYIAKSLQAEITYSMQQEVFGHVCYVNLRGIRSGYSGKLSSILIQDTEFISENLVFSCTELVSAVLTFAFGFYFIAQINLYFVFLVLPLGLISSISIRAVSRKSFENLNEYREIYTKLWKSFHEGILGFFSLRLHDSMTPYFDKVTAQGKVMKQKMCTQGRLESLAYFVSNALFMITIGLIMILSSVFVVFGKMTLGGLTAVMMYNHMLSDPLLKIQEISHKLQRLKVSFLRILGILELPTEERKAVSGINEIKLVHAGFEIGGQTILADVNIRIGEGESVMVTGATGSGKTTLINLLAGIYPASSGQVIFKRDGENVDGMPRISYMLQDEYVFDDTLYENVAVGNKNLSMEEFCELLKICELEEVSASHSGSLGEDGSRLSGGERKRLLIARALADKSADLYIFDEMSASLDQDTFLRIWKRVDKFLEKKSRIYIEHNPVIEKEVKMRLNIRDHAVHVK